MFFQKSRALTVLSVFNGKLHWKMADLTASATFIDLLGSEIIFAFFSFCDRSKFYIFQYRSHSLFLRAVWLTLLREDFSARIIVSNILTKSQPLVNLT